MESIDGCDHRYVSFLHSCVMLLVPLLDLYVFIFGGVGLVYMCGLVDDWVRLCFWGSVLACVYVCRFSVLVCFVRFCGCCDSSAPNEDIVRFR